VRICVYYTHVTHKGRRYQIAWAGHHICEHGVGKIIASVWVWRRMWSGRQMARLCRALASVRRSALAIVSSPQVVKVAIGAVIMKRASQSGCILTPSLPGLLVLPGQHSGLQLCNA
jgi:hypothetical protein